MGFTGANGYLHGPSGNVTVLLGSVEMAFEQFVSKSTRKHYPSMAIRPDGRLRLNSDATAMVRGLGVNRIQLYWDKERRRIGLKAAPDNDASSYKLTFSGQQNSIDIGAKAFIRHIGLELTQKLDTKLEWNEGEQMFQAKLPRNGNRLGVVRTDL
jgi:hypothetical protein